MLLFGTNILSYRLLSKNLKINIQDLGLIRDNYLFFFFLFFFFFCKIDRRNMEMYKWKWMLLGALGCINNADFETN